MRPLLTPVLALLGLLTGLTTTTAHAYEDQWGLSVTTGYQLTGSRDAHRSGATVGAIADYGLGEVWTARARADYGFAPAAQGAPNLHTGSLAAELVYVLDILTAVPYFGLGAGAILFSDQGERALRPEIHVVAGLDYLLDREWSVGLDLRVLATGRGLQDRAYAGQFQLALRYVLAD